MTDPLTAALRALHAAGVIHSWVRPGMRLVDDEAIYSYMVVRITDDDVLWLSRDDMLDEPGDLDSWLNDDVATFRIADDAVTTAALLPIVREARGDATLSTRCRCTVRDDGGGWTDGPWDIVSTSEHVTISVHGTLASTERDALTAALVARAALVEVPA